MTLDLAAAAYWPALVLLALAWTLACVLWVAIRDRRGGLTTWLLGIVLLLLLPVAYIAVTTYQGL